MENKTKISQLEEQIKNLEREAGTLGKQKETAEKSRYNTKKASIAATGGALLKKYLQNDDKEYLREFYGICKEISKEYNKEKSDQKKIDKLNENKDKIGGSISGFIFDRLKTASDDERMVAGQYLFNKGVYYGCGDFGGFKNPTTCGGCHASETLLERLDLKKYAEFTGDRCYSIPEKVKEKAINNVSQGSIKEKAKQIKENLENIDKKLKGINQELHNKHQTVSAYKILNSGKVDYEKVEEKMPDFFNEILRSRGDKSGVEFATADIKNNVGLILTRDWNYYGSGGCEYGVTAIVCRDGKTKEEYFKYRDPYNASGDDYRYHFDKAEIVKVTDKDITVKLKSSRQDVGAFEIERTFELAKEEKPKESLEEVLSKEEQDKFNQKFNDIEKQLLDNHYKPNATMPMYVSLWGFQGTLPQGINTGQSVPYEKPEIIDKYVDARKGVAGIVIKAQIDHCAGHGKQYEWCGYAINKDGKANLVERECAYQLQLKEGKNIVMKAKEMIKEK